MPNKKNNPKNKPISSPKKVVKKSAEKSTKVSTKKVAQKPTKKTIAPTAPKKTTPPPPSPKKSKNTKSAKAVSVPNPKKTTSSPPPPQKKTPISKIKGKAPNKSKVSKPIKTTTKASITPSTPIRIRKTNGELCVVYKRQRNTLYKRRSRLNDYLANRKLTEHQQKVLQNKLLATNKKIEALTIKVFKCGKVYLAIKHERMLTLKHINKIKNQIKNDKSLSESAKNRLLGELVILNDEVRDYEQLMRMPIVEREKGKLEFDFDTSTGESHEVCTVWEVKKKLEPLLLGNSLFEYFILGSEIFHIATQYSHIMWAIDDYIAEIVASQRSSLIQTPIMNIDTNPSKKEVGLDRTV